MSPRWSELQASRKLGGVNLRVPIGADVSHALNALRCDLPHYGHDAYGGGRGLRRLPADDRRADLRGVDGQAPHHLDQRERLRRRGL